MELVRKRKLDPINQVQAVRQVLRLHNHIAASACLSNTTSRQTYSLDERVLRGVESASNSEKRDILARGVLNTQVHPVLLAVHNIYTYMSTTSSSI